MSKRAKQFAEDLRRQYQIDTVLVDERYTSSLARSGSPKGGDVDAKAAEIILQAWLDGCVSNGKPDPASS